ncbi:probable glycosyltransferase At3g42180 [Cynara cardunculus var. scolymus]|uniref:Exostosin-like protein n=1 Tax=Cynara cardunculus var. scolymus TaxID=59895 RepID=A0A103YHZ2_CYNCS|nr:probable glycosyltransferase At3g42180 [Cynara cardunculus var. scolymus]KVI09464.1 Exostosin-like protein [Cynara cardunculus var. scolymus]
MARIKGSFKGLFFMTSCTLITLKITFFSITSIPSTSKVMMLHSHDHDGRLFDDQQSEQIFNPAHISTYHQYEDVVPVLHEQQQPSIEDTGGFGLPPEFSSDDGGRSPEVRENGGGQPPVVNRISQEVVAEGGQTSAGGSRHSKEKPLNKEEVYHDKENFLENYNQMNKSLKIYVYPHAKTDPFANVLLPDNNRSPGGNYASESYFKIGLSMSHFVTQDPNEAHLFFLPFSIASMRHDKRIGVGGIKDFIKEYISTISHKYPFWNRTGGADHFYVACHSIGRTAMEKAPEVKINAIQVVCSSSYFLQGYNAHKDASIPQIWPRPGVRPSRDPSKRKMLAFYAGAMNSRVRESLVRTWVNDTEIGVHQNRLKTPYSESLLGSKFCIHAKGFEVNTARIGDAIYYGCIPVVLADHYDLPFTDILDWRSFSVVVSTEDIAFLKKILREIVDSNEYIKLQKNVLKVQNHFQWHKQPVDFDTFYMVMYELWLRRSSIRIHLLN